jgi:glycolate oxidase FAD binding subunit
MAETFKPETEAQVVEVVAWAAGEEAPLEILGRGSKRRLGRPVQASHGLDLSGLSGITLYEPEELVLSAKAGTPLAEIEAALAENNQQLAFEPADLGPLLGSPAGKGSIGGALACNLAGPRRIKAGAARDHFLGVCAVSGRGEAFKSGGRVVKNVTGYDLCKLLAGSYGTLAVMTQVTVKVLPAAEKTRTVLLYGLEPARAIEALAQALNSAHEVSGAAHLPAAAAAGSEVSYVEAPQSSVTAIRVEGTGPSVEYRTAALRKALAELGETEELHSHNSTVLWRGIRDVQSLLGSADAVVWRISVPPKEGPAVAGRIGRVGQATAFYDWGGGLVWLALPPTDDAGHEAVRAAVAESGGHATLLRAPEATRAAVPVFQPQDPAKAALTRRVKESFDPRGVLNPGRMAAGL